MIGILIVGCFICLIIIGELVMLKPKKIEVQYEEEELIEYVVDAINSVPCIHDFYTTLANGDKHCLECRGVLKCH